MKNLKFILIFCCLFTSAPDLYAQFGFNVVPVTSAKKNRRVAYDIAVTDDKGHTETIKANDRVDIVQSSGDNYRLKVRSQADSKTDRRVNNNAQRYYDSPKFMVDDNTDPKRFSPTVGTSIYPFKYRPQSGKFEKSFTLSALGGTNIRLGSADSKSSLAILLGVGASSVTVRPDDVDTAAKITESKDLGALTFSLNVIYSWDFLQIGVSTGFDHLFDNEHTNWTYQDRGWLSFGIGLNLFKASDGN